MHFEGIGRFGNVVLCDDIRREDNGKYLLIGSYGSGMTVFQIPTTVYLRVFVEFQADTLGEMQLDFEFRSRGAMISRFEGSINQTIRNDERPQYIPLELPPAAIDVANEGTLDLFAISPNAEAKIRSLDIQLRATPPTG